MNKKQFMYLVNKRFILCFFPLILLIHSCKKEENKVLFEMPFRTQFTLNAGLNPFQVHYIQIDGIQNPLKTLLQDRGLTLEDLSGIEAGNARITAEIPGISYRFIREISVRLYKGDPSNSADFREMWYRADSNLLGEDDQFDLIPSLADGFAFLQEDEFNLSIVIQLREVTPVTMENQLDFTFFVR